jgi:urea transport system ATP-binding protein
MSNTDFALAIEDLTVSFDGFKAIDTLTSTSIRTSCA